MAARAEIKAVLSLNDVAFVRGMKRAMDTAKNLARQFAKNPIKTTFLAGAVAAQKAANAIGSSMKMVGIAAVGAFAVASAAVGGLAVGLAAISIKAIDAAAKFETMEVGFEVFLGSAQAAHDRMAELAAFSAHTPFQLGEIAQASQELQVLTQGALATGKGLEMVGDIASGTNRAFGEMAVTVGRLYAGLRSGTNVGESLRSLQDSGGLSPSAVRRIEGMASVDGAAAWRMAQVELGRFSGMMEKKSKTWEGLMSTFHDNINLALAAFGKPLLEALKPQLDLMIELIDAAKPKIAELGKDLAIGIKFALGVLEETLVNPDKLLGVFMSMLDAGAHGFVAILKDGLSSIGASLQQLLQPIADSQMGRMMGIDKLNFTTANGDADRALRNKSWDEAMTQLSKMAEAGRTSLMALAGGLRSEYTFEKSPTRGMSLADHSTALQTGGLSTGGLSGSGLSTGGLSSGGSLSTSANAFQSGFFKSSIGPKLPGLLANAVKPLGIASMGKGGLSGGATATVNSLVPLMERRAAEQEIRGAKLGKAYLETGRWTTGGPLGKVRAGDHAAAKAYVLAQQREKVGLDKTNQILGNLETKFDQAWLK